MTSFFILSCVCFTFLLSSNISDTGDQVLCYFPSVPTPHTPQHLSLHTSKLRRPSVPPGSRPVPPHSDTFNERLSFTGLILRSKTLPWTPFTWLCVGRKPSVRKEPGLGIPDTGHFKTVFLSYSMGSLPNGHPPYPLLNSNPRSTDFKFNVRWSSSCHSRFSLYYYLKQNIDN